MRLTLSLASPAEDNPDRWRQRREHERRRSDPSHALFHAGRDRYSEDTHLLRERGGGGRERRGGWPQERAERHVPHLLSGTADGDTHDEGGGERNRLRYKRGRWSERVVGGGPAPVAKPGLVSEAVGEGRGRGRENNDRLP